MRLGILCNQILKLFQKANLKISLLDKTVFFGSLKPKKDE